MKKNNKKVIIGIILIFLVAIIGVAYAYYSYVYTGEQNEIVTGQIYMNMVEKNQIILKEAFPESKEEGLERTDNSFNFEINGLNTSDETIYYGISITNGDEQEGTRISPEHIIIYLERDGEVLIDGIRYNNWDNQRFSFYFFEEISLQSFLHFSFYHCPVLSF